jgi:hypothetical protein
VTWPGSFRGSRYSQVGEVAASSEMTSVTAGTPAHTKGSWTQLVASCPFNANGFFLSFSGGNTNTHDILVDVGVGASGSEQVILSNFLNSLSGFISAKHSIFIPLPIKEGERIAVRFQSSTASATCAIGLQLVAGDFYSQLGLGRATTYGANTADSGGTEIDPGGAANTKGAWAQIVASTTNPIRYMVICNGSRANGVYNASGTSLMDIAVGAAASEQILIDDIFLVVTGGGDLFEPGSFARPANVAAGQRLAARVQTTVTDATDRLRDIVIIGFD